MGGERGGAVETPVHLRSSTVAGQRVDRLRGQQRAPRGARAGGVVAGQERPADHQVVATAGEVGHARVRLQRARLAGHALEQPARWRPCGRPAGRPGRGLLEPGGHERHRARGPAGRRAPAPRRTPRARRRAEVGDLTRRPPRAREPPAPGHEADARDPPAVRGSEAMRCENIDRMAPLFAGPPVLCGHRGMGVGTVLGHVENTLGSFLAAAALGLPWVEVDVRVTADDVLVCGHDPVVEDGRFVIDLTAGRDRRARAAPVRRPARRPAAGARGRRRGEVVARGRAAAAGADDRGAGRARARRARGEPPAARHQLRRDGADDRARARRRPDGAADVDALPAAQGDPGRRAPRGGRRPAALLLARRRAGAGADRARARPSTSRSRTRRGSRWRRGRRRRRRRSRWSRRGSTASSSTTPTRAPGRPGGPGRPAVAARVNPPPTLQPASGRRVPTRGSRRESPPPRGGVFRPRKGGGTATGAGRACRPAHVASRRRGESVRRASDPPTTRRGHRAVQAHRLSSAGL